jgi:hypothetical protein
LHHTVLSVAEDVLRQGTFDHDDYIPHHNCFYGLWYCIGAIANLEFLKTLTSSLLRRITAHFHTRIERDAWA